MKKISFIAFWEEFDTRDNIITNTFLSKYDNIVISDDYMASDILFVGSFVDIKLYNILLKYKGLKILCITEPIEYFYKYTFKLYKQNYFNSIIGCVNNSENTYKYPFYLWNLDMDNFDVFSNVNNYVKNINLDDKKFACLINRHDKGNTRIKIYNLLCKINNIDCPSKLLNNCSNEELNNIGNVEYIKKYIFNICPENYRCSINGYITEKLMNTCLAGSIPIYFGSYDDIDEKIFNKNRIIFYNPYDKSSVQNVYNTVQNLYNNKKKLEDFYKQDVFCNTAIETIISMHDNVQKMFDKYIL